MKKTYEDFGIMLEKLKEEAEVSYDGMGRKIDISYSTLQRIAKTRAVDLPKYEIMEKVAKFFHLGPTFFYEYRLRKVLDYIDNNRKFLNIVERAMRKHRGAEISEEELEEDPEEELASEKKR